jgi:hypothetical protein
MYSNPNSSEGYLDFFQTLASCGRAAHIGALLLSPNPSVLRPGEGASAQEARRGGPACRRALCA